MGIIGENKEETIKNEKKEKKITIELNLGSAVTLIALVITIIVLLVLAGVTINLVLKEDGIFSASEKGVSEYNKQEATEKLNLKITKTQMQTYADNKRMPTLQELANDLEIDTEIQYVETKSKKLASTVAIDIGDATSIFTKLKDYPYEFEINSSLQLASINGVTIGQNPPNANTSQPTGIRTDAFICNIRKVTPAYLEVTSMTGFERTTDDNNNIAEYLSYSDETGYTVLKTGWYFMDMTAYISASAAADLSIRFNINGRELAYARVWAGNNSVGTDGNSFPIFLNQGDILYWIAGANGASAKERIATAYLYPMF